MQPITPEAVFIKSPVLKGKPERIEVTRNNPPGFFYLNLSRYFPGSHLRRTVSRVPSPRHFLRMLFT
jgi:hypothetical protein